MLFTNRFIFQIKIITRKKIYNSKYKVIEINLWRDKFKIKKEIKKYKCIESYNYYNEPIINKKFIK